MNVNANGRYQAGYAQGKVGAFGTYAFDSGKSFTGWRQGSIWLLHRVGCNCQQGLCLLAREGGAKKGIGNLIGVQLLQLLRGTGKPMDCLSQ